MPGKHTDLYLYIDSVYWYCQRLMAQVRQETDDEICQGADLAPVRHPGNFEVEFAP